MRDESGFSPFFTSSFSGGERIGKTPFRRCIHCGMYNDTRKTAWAKKGDGVIRSGPRKGESSSGCVFCGSKHWLKGKPVKLPEGDNYPALPNRRNRRNR